MNIQIIGTKKSSDTKKAQRFFSDRGISFHFLDLKQKALSEGELKNLVQALGVEALLDESSAAYRKKGLAYMEFDPVEEILENNDLLALPLVRWGRKATVGVAEKTWKAWIDEAKG